MNAFHQKHMNFNSQPHKEADIYGGFIICQMHISTHSLTRRLTYSYKTGNHISEISTHSLTRRLTAAIRPKKQNISYFNSQPHKEADLTKTIIHPEGVISTHSLTRRLTAILFNKNRFVQFIFIALYQSPPSTSPPSSFFSPYFLIFSKNIRCESPEDW